MTRQRDIGRTMRSGTIGRPARVRYGVNFDGSAWVAAPEGDYRIEAPAGQIGYTAGDLLIVARPDGESSVTDADLRWMAMDAFCDAYGAV
jgi:hypothetical protein